ERGAGGEQQSRQTIASQFIGAERRGGGRRRFNSIAILGGVGKARQEGAEHRSAQKHAENRHRRQSHARLPGSARAVPSASAPHIWVASAISMVRVTITGKSRAVAAFQASCPRPGRSLTVSTGMAAPKAIASETPARASNSGAQTGITC